jgi:uncharacterized protein (TIGR00251 family)
MGDLAIRVQPRAKRTEIAGERGGAVVVRVNAPPVEGRANAAVCRLIAQRLGLPKTAVEVVRGGSGRDKVVRITGLSADEARTRLLS